MTITTSLPADATAERIVRHFQAAGFPGITEALLIRVRLKKGDLLQIEAAFDVAAQNGSPLPLREFFDLQLYGFYSEIRALLDAKLAFPTDFGRNLRLALPRVHFSAPPAIADDALATGTKYDALLKLGENMDGCSVGILLNDPTSSFFEYLDAQPGYDWQKIAGDLGAAATSYVPDEDLL